MNKTFIFVLFTLFISFCFAGEEQAIDQVIDNKIHIKIIEKQQEKLSDRINEKTEQQQEYTDNEIQEQIDILLKDRNNVLCMREKWIDWVMMVLTALIAFFGIGVTIYFFIKGRKQSKEFEEQKAKISKILEETETEQLDIKGESRKLQMYSQQRIKELDNLFDELKNKKKEIENLVESAKADIYELSKNSLIKDKKIKPQLYTIIDDILTEKEESNFDANDWIIKGNDLLEKEDFEKAFYYYSKAIKIDAKNSYAHNAQGVCYERMGDLKKALGAYDKAIEYDKENYTAYCNRGNCKRELFTPEEGLEDIEKSISLAPMTTNGYSSRATIKSKLGDFKGAVDDRMKVIEIDPQDVIEYLNLLELSLLSNTKEIWDRYYGRTLHLKKDTGEESIISYLKAIYDCIFKNLEINIILETMKLKQLLSDYDKKVNWTIIDMLRSIEKSKSLNKKQKKQIVTFTEEFGNYIKEHNMKYEKTEDNN